MLRPGSFFAFPFGPVHPKPAPGGGGSVWRPCCSSSIIWCSSLLMFGSLSRYLLTTSPAASFTSLLASFSPFRQQHTVSLLAVQYCPNNASEGAVTQFVPALPFARTHVSHQQKDPVGIVRISFQGFIYFHCCREGPEFSVTGCCCLSDVWYEHLNLLTWISNI